MLPLLINQQALDSDRKAIQQINFTANWDRAGYTRIYFIPQEVKETVLDVSQWTVKFCKYNSIEWFDFYQYKMTQCNSLKVKLSNSQLNKFKSAIKNKTKVVLRLSSNMVGDDETNFSHKL